MAESDRPERPALRSKRLRVQVTEAEHAQIAASAADTRLSVSSYLRALGVGFRPKSTVDHQAVLALVNVHGDQGRLGGLLKLWLSEKPGQGASVVDVRRLLGEIEAAQVELRQLMRRL